MHAPEHLRRLTACEAYFSLLLPSSFLSADRLLTVDAAIALLRKVFRSYCLTMQGVSQLLTLRDRLNPGLVSWLYTYLLTPNKLSARLPFNRFITWILFFRRQILIYINGFRPWMRKPNIFTPRYIKEFQLNAKDAVIQDDLPHFTICEVSLLWQ